MPRDHQLGKVHPSPPKNLTLKNEGAAPPFFGSHSSSSPWPERIQNLYSGYSGEGGVRMAVSDPPIVGKRPSDQSVPRRTKMNTQPNVVAPKRGDRVSMVQQEGVYEVADINSLMQTANLKTTDGQGHITRNVPWTALKPLGKK